MKKPSPEVAVRSRRGRWIVLLLAILAAPFVAELWLRFLLFSDASLANRFGAELRDPGLFADATFQDEYWRLRERLGAFKKERSRRPPQLHPQIGWLNTFIDADTLDHADHFRVGDRRPVLMYGASFTSRDYSYLVEKSDLAEEYALLHYGVGGFGADQAYLLMQKSLQHYLDEDPIVLFGLKSDGDFERCNLSIRVWPKPRFELDEAGELRLEVAEVPPIERYFEEHPIGIRSYLVSHLVHSNSVLPAALRRRLAGTDETERRSRALITALVRAIDADLEARDVPYGYVLFCGLETAKGQGPGVERERFLVELFDREGIPYVLIGQALRQASDEHGEPLEDYFHPPRHRNGNHPNGLGQLRTFPSLRRAILGDFEGH